MLICFSGLFSYVKILKIGYKTKLWALNFPACTPGFFGPSCNIKCPTGFFGLDCGGVCRPICSEDNCHHVYGCLKSTTDVTQTDISGKNHCFCKNAVIFSIVIATRIVSDFKQMYLLNLELIKNRNLKKIFFAHKRSSSPFYKSDNTTLKHVWNDK